jgi:hypothetical protein
VRLDADTGINREAAVMRGQHLFGVSALDQAAPDKGAQNTPSQISLHLGHDSLVDTTARVKNHPRRCGLLTCISAYIASRRLKHPIHYAHMEMHVLVQTGAEAVNECSGSDVQCRLVYLTNMATSYAAGRHAQMSDPEVLQWHPYWRYIHSDGVLHPRPMHLAWHGLTLSAEHPFFQTHFAPNGWGCQCRITSVSRAEGERSKAAGLGEPPAGWDQIDPKTGAQVGIDKGFDYAFGTSVKASMQSFVDAKLMKLSPELVQALSQEAATVLGTQISVLGTQKSVESVIKDALVTAPLEAVIPTNRLDTMKNMTVAEFRQFFDDEPNMPARIAVAALTDADRKLYGTTATDLWLSRVSLDWHKDKHPEITFEDYLQIPEIMRLAQVWAGHKDKRYLLLMLAEKAYRAAIKIDASGDEAWFLSLVVSPKQKPPKGAVRIR